MRKSKSILVAALTAALLWSCSTPTNISYFQDMKDQQVLENQAVSPIRLNRKHSRSDDHCDVQQAVLFKQDR